MPYNIEENHPRCDSNEVGLEKEDGSEFFGCHESRESARDQIAVIEQNKQMDLSDLLVTPPVRSVKDLDDKGTFGGYLINFGSKEDHDLENDFFDKKTDFWLDLVGKKSAVLFGHGTDDVFGTKRLDKGGADLKVDDEGIWMETQLRRRNEYEEMVHQLAREGKLGLSSGTASHLVEREVAGEVDGKQVHHIKKWPVGLDATLTPTPAEPRVMKIMPLEETEQKSIKEFGLQGQAENVSVLIDRFAKTINTKATDEEIDERYEEFQQTVNMSASEIESWGEKECSDKASQNPERVRNRVISLLRTNKSEWGDSEYGDAGQVISFVSRMRGVSGGDKPSQDCPTKKVIALKNWGYDPNKSTSVMKEQHDYSRGDLVAWEGGDAQGRIVEVVGPDESVSPSTTDREFSGNEDEDGYLIELVDMEDGEVVGRDETVFHLGSTLEGITESDVKVASIGDTLDGIINEVKDHNGPSSEEEVSLQEINNQLDSINKSIT